MKKKYFFAAMCLLLLSITFGSCKKFLAVKSVAQISTPDNLNDLQLILDNITLNDGLNSINTGTDEYYVSYTAWLPLTEVNKKGYIWDSTLNSFNDWRLVYQTVFYTNTVLFNLNLIKAPGDGNQRNNIKGAALFIRAHAFFLLAQQFAPQFDESSASNDLGIVLRLNVDINESSTRATVKQTYHQIIKDLEEAAKLLDEDRPLYKTRPGRAACLALLARVYLQIGDFTKAKDSADACLKIAGNLIDYNGLTSANAYPFGDFNRNEEIIFHFKTSLVTPLNGDETRARVEPDLYKSFEEGDLRKKMFFKENSDKSYTFKGSYTGDKVLFNGIGVDEVYLIRAECYARMNNITAAMEDLNALLKKRWDPAYFVKKVSTSSLEALKLILLERRKELLYRGIRWSDLRRLNKESRFAVTLKRDLNGQIYQLPPNDLRYTLLIPTEIISRTGLPQNPR